MSDASKVDDGRVGRRSFLWRLSQTALVGAGFGLGAAWTFDPEHPIKQRKIKGKRLRSFAVPVPASTPRVVVARGSDPTKNVRAALQHLGGMEVFVKRGDRVLLKPNAAFDRTPAQAANVSPEVVAEVVRQCRAAGAREVIVTENTLFSAERCWSTSGIDNAVRRAGGRVVVPSKNDFVETRIDGLVLDSWPFLKTLFEVDKVINLPTAKHHSLARVSLGLKNWMGAIGGKRRQMHQKLDQCIADLAQTLRPTLVVLDGSRVLMRHGPTGGRLADVDKGDTIICGWDQVAVDREALPLLGATLGEVKHLSTAARRGLGRLRLRPGERVEIRTG